MAKLNQWNHMPPPPAAKHPPIIFLSSIILILFITAHSSLSFTAVYGQATIDVPAATPCFLNNVNNSNILASCSSEGNPFDLIILGWQWITGGNFVMIIVGIIILAVWRKYDNVVYPLFIGVLFLPITFFLFPESFLSWALILAGLAVGILIFKALVLNASNNR